MKKVIAFSLWGDKPKYCIGAIRNAELAAQIYPGWVCQFHIAGDVPKEVVDKLSQFNNTEIIYHLRAEADWNAMFWRFYAASDDTIDVMLSRDCDSRLSLREKAAVEEWLKTDKGFHIMRDHPYHGVPILGGMWGAKKNAIPNFFELLENRNKEHYWQVDQEFLRDVVYPIIRYNAVVHDEFFEKKKFPLDRSDNYEYVGEVIDEFEKRNEEHIQILKNHLNGSKK